MNKLVELHNMGFKVTWKVISIGLYGARYIPVQLTRDEVFDYLDHLLYNTNKQTDNIVNLICNRDDDLATDKLLVSLADNDGFILSLQLRKWRTLLLSNTLNSLSQDYLQGLLELMDFWMSMGPPKDCPLSFPNTHSSLTTEKFFTQTMYEMSVYNNYDWLKNEVSSIIESEKSYDWLF